ncbi:hypothetical protein ES319_D12G042100v1 [Gossypium barbadense]|uniref:Uncharacterized protein n=2 Tax=Gossypium TaxID=3633 RepID=A0A5J5NY21_GOSBA|nr:hypothetical protein ES319_D12G042100v1 [Gossypium barbadense]TYG39798.1 hypothetical protein ES288_D12G044200v1 [Gossypium darwinii]
MATSSFLRNRYWVLRHGKSIPNEKGLIVSSLENGIRLEYQLASEGVEQAELAGKLFLKELKENDIPLENVRMCYSPFARTRHTAEVMEDLRERYFGPSFELLPHDKYTEIWAMDEKDPFTRPEGGESVDDVASRLASAMATMESEYQGKYIYNMNSSGHW